MAFVQRNILKSVAPRVYQLARPLSTGHVEKSVLISQSTDVHTNLALEEWLNTNFDFTKQHVMLYYRNDPCVLLGKDANPWLDTNIPSHPETADKKSVALARRQGSGASLYQDQGMVNLTFFGTNEQLDPHYNLSVVARAMFRKYGMRVNQDETNLSFYNMKISGAGGQTGASNSYQNCSLLVDVNKTDRSTSLQKTKGTTGGKQSYLNICEIDPQVTAGGLLSAVGWEFMRTPAFTLKDAGHAFASKQRGFQMVNPTEGWFPGITAIRERLANWDWCYGETPKFTILRSFPVPAQFLNAAPSNPIDELRIKLVVDEGKISDVTLFIPPGFAASGFTGEAKVITGLKGHKFTEEALLSIASILGVNNYEAEKKKFVTDCVKQAMSV